MISLKSRGFHSCRVIVEPEAAHDIFDCEFLRQPIESLDGLLSPLYVGCSIAVLIVEIGFCQSAKVVALTSILDVGDELSQTPVHIVRLKRTGRSEVLES